MRTEIENVIIEIRKRYREELSLDELAEIARLSPFHLSRIFRRETGLPPGRYVTAVRLEEAKRRLLTTDASVSDISVDVGYSSLGTFTSRFTELVGISPGRYRRLGSLGRDPAGELLSEEPARYGAIRGQVGPTQLATTDPVFVGIHCPGDHAGHPLGCKVVSSGISWTLRNVPTGRWFVHAVSLMGDPASPRSLAVAGAGPVDIAPGQTIPVNLTLSPHSLLSDYDSPSETELFSLTEVFLDPRVH